MPSFSIIQEDNPQLLGEGTYGKVYKIKVCDQDNNINEYAMKKMFYEHNISGFGNISEIEILNSLSRSKFIPKILYINIDSYEFKTQSTKIIKEEFISFIYEKSNTDGNKFFSKGEYDISTGLKLAAELLLAIEHMHRHDICHRDIKPGNILIFKDTNNVPTLKLCDFGFSIHITSNGRKSPGVNTPWYRAPEIAWVIKNYNSKSDIFCAGCTIFEIFSHYPLLSSITNFNENNDIKLTDYFNELLKVNPNEWTIDLQKLYRNNTSSEFINHKIKGPSEKVESSTIRKINTNINNFMKCFERSSKNNMSQQQLWKNANDIVVKCLDYDYKRRTSAESLLKSDLFDHHREYIDSSLKYQHRTITYDVIEINIDNNLNQKKIDFFTDAIKFLPSIDLRTMFHAVDLANVFLTSYPNTVLDLNNVFSCCIYFFHKMFSKLRTPHNPQRFFFKTFFKFDNFENIKDEYEYEKYIDQYISSMNIDSIKEMDLFIYDFEHVVIDSEKLTGFKTYRPGIYEIQSDYKHFLSDSKLTTMFLEFCKINKWKEKSYRNMYRTIYVDKIDPNFSP